MVDEFAAVRVAQYNSVLHVRHVLTNQEASYWNAD